MNNRMTMFYHFFKKEKLDWREFKIKKALRVTGWAFCYRKVKAPAEVIENMKH